MKLRVLGVLSVLSVLIVIFASTAILTSASRELTQELRDQSGGCPEPPRAGGVRRRDGRRRRLAVADRDGQVLGTVWGGSTDPPAGRHAALGRPDRGTGRRPGRAGQGGPEPQRHHARSAAAFRDWYRGDLPVLRQRKPGPWRGGPGRQPGCCPAEAAGTVARRRSGCGRPRGGAAPRRRPRDQVGAASRAPPEFGGNGA